MSNSPNTKIFLPLFLVAAALFAATVWANDEKAASSSLPVDATDEQPLTYDAAVFLADLKNRCETAKMNLKAPTAADLAACRSRIQRAMQELNYQIAIDPNRQSASFWKEKLELDALNDALASSEELKPTFVEKAWKTFGADHDGIQWKIFTKVRNELQNYLSLNTAIESKDFDENLPLVCDNLTESAQKYLRRGEPDDSMAIHGILRWLDAFRPFNPPIGCMIDCVRNRFSNANVQVWASDRFVSPAFQQPIHESFDVNENIFGTAVRGNGTVSGRTIACPVPRQGAAAFQLQINTQMNTRTTGSHPPVTLKNATSGAMSATKTIIFTPNGFTATAAQSRGNLNTKVIGTHIDGGCLVKCIAKDRIEEQRPASEAEAKRRAAVRFSGRVDRQVETQLATLNQNYQANVCRPLHEVDYFPKRWGLSTTNNFVIAQMAFANPSQTTTDSLPPNQAVRADVVVRVHQSALNNTASLLMSGRTLKSDNVDNQMLDRLKKWVKIDDQASKENDEKITPTLAQDHPISVSFEDNKIKLVCRIANFNLEDGPARKLQSDIIFLYEIENGHEIDAYGRSYPTVAFVQADKPRAVSPGRKTLSTRDLPVQRRVMTRLEETVQKRIQLLPADPAGRWEGTGKLVPVYAAAENGWLTLAWNWVRYVR